MAEERAAGAPDDSGFDSGGVIQMNSGRVGSQNIHSRRTGNAERQGFKVSRFQGFKVSRFQGFKVSRFQGFKVSRFQGFKRRVYAQGCLHEHLFSFPGWDGDGAAVQQTRCNATTAVGVDAATAARSRYLLDLRPCVGRQVGEVTWQKLHFGAWGKDPGDLSRNPGRSAGSTSGDDPDQLGIAYLSSGTHRYAYAYFAAGGHHGGGL